MKGSAGHVLVVDDQRENIRCLGNLLDEHGYQVHVAESGEQAVRLAEALAPRIAVLDVEMPRMSGFEAARRIGQVSPATRIVGLSMYSDSSYRERMFEAGGEWLRVAQGLNFREQGSVPRDPLDYEGNPGHGTRTASVLCGEADPPVVEDGIASEIGVAPRLPVAPCRSMGYGSSAVSDHRPSQSALTLTP